MRRLRFGVAHLETLSAIGLQGAIVGNASALWTSDRRHSDEQGHDPQVNKDVST